MKEFIEKLMDRLEELPTKAIDRYKGGSFGNWEGTDYFIKQSDAIEIINQLAEEYKPCNKPSCKDCEVYDKEKHYCPKWCEVIKHTASELAEEYNNGWIPVSSGNPKETGLYQVTVDDNDEPVITAMYLAEVDIWSYHAGYGNYMKVLAWRSLPQPYQPKGE